MQISLQNIGIVKDSSIIIDGLTVITGKNNSGKTTVGKTLYALLDSVSNLQQKAKSDKLNYIRRQLEKVEYTLEVFRFLRNTIFEDKLDCFSEYPTLKALFSRDYQHEFPQDEIEQVVIALTNELSSFDLSLFEKNELLQSYQRYMRFDREQENTSFINIFNNQKEQAISILQKLLDDLDKDPELIAYARESINQTLRVEFSNQIQPVRDSDTISKIQLLDDEAVYFSLSVADNNVIDDGTPVFISSPYKKVYLIDDPFILDDMYMRRRFRREFDTDDSDTILNPDRIYSHNFKLKAVLKNRKSLSVFEQTVLSDSLREISAQFDRVIPGTFEFSPEGDYYIKNGSKLKISNLATGSKMFSIVKMLLDKGEIDNTTMLILDEPEAHLHPMWQNSFAEIIVLLVKKLGVTILLTTHSSNFMLALDAYMRKYDIADKTNFYQTDALEDDFVQYHCVNDDIGIIYQDFLQYLSEVKILRNKYIHDIEG